MKLKKYLPLLGTLILVYLAFVENIAINLGDDDTYISRTAIFEKNNPSASEFFGDDATKEGCRFINLADYEAFLTSKTYPNFYFSDQLLLDTTGDGDKEVVKSTVQLVDGRCSVKQEILKGGKHIWNDSFTFTKHDVDFYFGTNTFTDKELEKALFYLGLSHASFTEKMANPEGFPKRLQLMATDYFKDSNLLEKDKIDSDFMRELKSYKGHYVFKRHPSSLGIFMWDNTNEQFIQVYAPERAV